MSCSDERVIQKFMLKTQSKKMEVLPKKIGEFLLSVLGDLKYLDAVLTQVRSRPLQQPSLRSMGFEERR